MLLLPWIGTRDEVDLLGYVIERCPSCRTVGVFGVFDVRKRLTLAMIPGRTYQRHQVLECKTCHARFGVPEDQRAALAARLMTQDELSERVKHLGDGRGPAYAPGAGPRTADGAAPRRTLYQVLQVDPAAEPEVIEAAFKRLALKYHPDRSTAADAAERTRELIEARETLIDPRRRAAYDAGIGFVRRPPPRARPPAMRPEEV